MNLHFAGAVTSLAWSPNGQVLAAASLDAPGFVVFDISLGVNTPLQAGVHAFRGSARGRLAFQVSCSFSCVVWEVLLLVTSPKLWGFPFQELLPNN